MRRVQCLCDLADDVPRPAGRQRALPPQQRAHVPARDEPHGDEQDAGGLARLVDRDDVGVVDGRRRARLADEPVPELGVRGQAGGNQLDRHLAAPALIAGAVDHGHAALADLFLDAVTGDVTTWAGRTGR